MSALPNVFVTILWIRIARAGGTLEIVNRCADGSRVTTVNIMGDGRILSGYTGLGSFVLDSVDRAALFSGDQCGSEGENCTMVEVDFHRAEMVHSVVDLVPPHRFNIPVKVQYINGCEVGTTCLSAGCPDARRRVGPGVWDKYCARIANTSPMVRIIWCPNSHDGSPSAPSAIDSSFSIHPTPSVTSTPSLIAAPSTNLRAPGIIGVAVGGAGLLAIVFLAIIYLRRLKQKRDLTTTTRPSENRRQDILDGEMQNSHDGYFDALLESRMKLVH